MFQSLKLGKVFGIDLFIHGTFWLLPLFVLFSSLSSGDGLAETGTEVALVLAVFACVALHEFGHALAARGYGIRTRDITLYPIGGVASLERMPERPGREIAIALAGPAVNFVIAAAIFAGFLGSVLLAPGSVSERLTGPQEFAARLMWANLILGTFNLLPCFPMDGGRVLRAILATRLSRLRATEIAAKVGSVVAGGFVVAGLAFGHFGLIGVAIVVWLLGQAELAGVRMQFAAEALRRQAGEFLTPSADGPPPVGPSYTGLVWDDARRVWVQYDNGYVVRVIDPRV